MSPGDPARGQLDQERKRVLPQDTAAAGVCGRSLFCGSLKSVQHQVLSCGLLARLLCLRRGGVEGVTAGVGVAIEAELWLLGVPSPVEASHVRQSSNSVGRCGSPLSLVRCQLVDDTCGAGWVFG